MRSTNSIKNAIVAVIMNIINILIGFIAQKVFVIALGSEYLGLNGLFSNVLSILAVVELGFGNAIIYHLYKPVAEDNKKEIKVLVKYYKNVYRVIAFVIFVLGLIVMPFIQFIIGEVSISESLHLLFFLALIDIVASYLLTYKRSILYANQKNYVVNLVHIGYVLLMNISEIILLLITKNYLLYLIVKIAFRLLENIVISLLVDKMYPYIREKCDDELDDKTKKDIKLKVNGLLFHKIGSSVVLGSDNIIISKMLGVVVVGLYSNYSMIITAVSNVLSQIFSSITSVVGNLLIENDKNKSYDIYKKMQLMNSWIYCWAGTCILCLIQPFVEIWMGKSYLLSFGVVVALVINFYVTGMRKTNTTFKEAAGIFYEDRFVPLIEIAINIIASVVLAYFFGLAGIFIGTIMSSAALFLYSFPVFMYKRLFDRSYFQFLKEFFYYTILSIICMVVTYVVISLIHISSLILTLAVNLIICMIIPNIIYFIIFRKTDDFKYYVDLMKNVVLKRFKKDKVIKSN